MTTLADRDRPCPHSPSATTSSTPDLDAIRAGLLRLQEIEQGTREVQRAIRYALDDLSAALEAQRQLRTELLQALDMASGQIPGGRDGEAISL